MGDIVEFHLQSFLSEMRREQTDGLKRVEDKIDLTRGALEAKLDGQATIINDHETRLVLMESYQRSLRWFGRTTIAAVITFFFDLLVNHVPHLWKLGAK